MGNKLNKVLLTIRYFLRYRSQKKKALRFKELWEQEKQNRLKDHENHQLELEIAFQSHKQEQDKLRETYENQIYLERFRGDSLQRDMTDRFLQLMGLNPMLYSDAAAPSSPLTKAKEELKSDKQEKAEKERELRDVKLQFWVDGQELGKSEEEINYEWEMRKEEIYSDVRLSRQPFATIDQEQ